EDGIRDLIVTGVQTCALPIFGSDARMARHVEDASAVLAERREGRRTEQPGCDEVDVEQLSPVGRGQPVQVRMRDRPADARVVHRSEERRVGKEWGCVWWPGE